MIEYFLGAVIIMFMRICDVTIGTVRIIMVSQGKRYYAAFAGFFEVLIWIFAMRYVVQHLDNTINLIGYSIGYSLGNVLGVTVEQKIGIGFLQLNVVSQRFSCKIAGHLRNSRYGVTLLPAVGNNGDVNLLFMVIRRKDQKQVIKLIESIDPEAFITAQSSVPYRGFIHGSRK
jgi:uncharacterized protein YebE (UPF0316 family)